MRGALKSFLAAFFLFCAPAFAQGHGPALWKVSGAETNVYIFGSVLWKRRPNMEYFAGLVDRI